MINVDKIFIVCIVYVYEWGEIFYYVCERNYI